MLTSLSYAPSTSPIDPQHLYRHMRLLSRDDYVLADSYATVATELVEDICSRFLLTKQVVWTVAHDPVMTGHVLNESLMPWQWSTFLAHPVVTLPRPASVISRVAVGTWGNPDLVMVEGVDYATDYTTAVARIKWISGAFRQYQKDHLQISFTSGYGDSPDSIPMPLKQAIVLVATNLFERRGDEMPDVFSSAVQNLIASYRFNSFG